MDDDMVRAICSECDEEFSISIHRANADDVFCPYCGSDNIEFEGWTY